MWMDRESRVAPRFFEKKKPWKGIENVPKNNERREMENEMNLYRDILKFTQIIWNRWNGVCRFLSITLFDYIVMPYNRGNLLCLFASKYWCENVGTLIRMLIFHILQETKKCGWKQSHKLHFRNDRRWKKITLVRSIIVRSILDCFPFILEW